MHQNFKFELQRFATGTAVIIGGVINNVEVGDTFTVDGANYKILSVEKDSVTAIVDGTPAENLGKKIVISDTKSIDGVTYETIDVETVDGEISTKYIYKLDIGGKAVFITVFDNAIETVTDSGGNVLSDYKIGGKNFTLTLDNGIPIADYINIPPITATLERTTYSFSVDSKDVVVEIDNTTNAISTVTIDSAQVNTSGSYSVGTKQLQISYADESFNAQIAQINSVVDISPVASYTIDDTTVTVDSSGQPSPMTATLNGHTANLSYDSTTNKVTATYTSEYNAALTTTEQTYTVSVGSDSVTITVKIDGDLYNGTTKLINDTVEVDGKKVNLKYENNTLTGKLVIVNLNTLNADCTAQDGDVLTGNPVNHKISIADGATVTLRNVNITSNNSAGIICEGSATIILEGDNTLNGSTGCAGIQAGGTGTTLTITGTGKLTVKGGPYGAGIGSGQNGTCGNITISGGTITATGGKFGAGIGSGQKGTCGNITIENTVTKVTATKGSNANTIGAGSNNSCGTITIGGEQKNQDYFKNDNPYTYQPNGGDTDNPNEFQEQPSINLTSITQTATLDDKTVTFTTNDSGTTTYKIDNGAETTLGNGGEITTGNKKYTATVDTNNKVTNVKYDTVTFDLTSTTYNFNVDDKVVAVMVDSSGKMTYGGIEVMDNKITVDGGIEVTLNTSGNAITGATYFGKFSAVTNIIQVDAYTVTIDGEEVHGIIFDANNQCSVEVGGKNYLVTKTADGATIASDETATGIEDSRIYLLQVGDEKHWINCTFDADGKLSAVTSNESISIEGTTVKFGNYTIEVGGTWDNLTASGQETVHSSGKNNVSVKQLFTLSGVKSTDGITVANGVVTLTAANLNNQDVTITGDGYTLALDKNYSSTITPAHFDGNVYKSASNTDGYKISDDAKKISYTTEIPATNLFTLSGVKSMDGITVANGVVTLTAANLNNQDVSITGDGYTLALDKNYSSMTKPAHFDGNVYKSASNTDGYK
ncbi:MAG: hypothetical protein IJ685_02890, partial [Selenomonadaceae bacterium]|nr:hypothetical protein [Selenomonadaceae bacterium]